MISRKIICSLVLLLWIVVGKAQNLQTKPSLTIGSPAPRLEVQHWLKGTPVGQFEKGRLYVVEFWATWCAPCIAAMPHLSDIARKYSNQVTVIGVSVWEGRKEPIPDKAVIQSFVDKKGKDMDYVVAMDNPETNKVVTAWMRTAGLNGIPATFVVDREGKIAWIGHPNGLEPVLEALVNNPEKFDRDLSKEQHDKDFHQNFIFQSAKSIQEMLSEKNYGLAWQEVQRLVREYPAFETVNFSSFISAYLGYDSKAALDYVLEKSKDVDFLRAKDPQKDVEVAGEELLDEFARIAAGRTGCDPRIYAMVVGRLNGAVEKKPDVSNLWGLLAQAYANLNEPEKAIAAQEKAIAVFQKSDTASASQLHIVMTEKVMERMVAQLSDYKDLKVMKDKLLH